MRIFKLKKFARFAKKQRIPDTKLIEIVAEMEAGIIHADLGGNVFKQRMAREGQGKRGSYRTVVFYKVGKRVFFVHGFLKADEETITNQEETDFKELATLYLGLPEDTLNELVTTAHLMEITNDDQS